MASNSISLNLSHTLTLTVSNTIDNANNRSWIAWEVKVDGSSTWYDTYVKATVNGSVVYNKTVGWNGGFPAQTGSTSGGFYVNHNSDGTKSISMALEGYVYSYSVSYTSGTLTCSPTDRSAPNVTTAVPTSGISHNSCTLNISSTDTIASSNGYAYQIKAGSGAYGDWIYNNNGSWTITGLTPNTAYTINGAAKKSSNNVWGYQTHSFTTLGQATLSSVSNTTLGNNATFKWTPLVASYQYRLQIKIGNTVIATFPSTGYITGPFTAGDEYVDHYNLPLSLASYITTSMSATATAVLTTYNGNTQIGEVSSKDFIITVPENSNTKPTLTVSSITLGEGETSGFGVLTTGYSTLKATIPTSAIGLKYGTTVNSIKMTVNNKTFTGTLSGNNYVITTSTLVTPGTHNVTFVLQDKRGLTATGSTSITFYEYFSPNGMISSEVNNTSDGFITNISWNVAPVDGNNRATVTVQRIKNSMPVDSDTTNVNSTNNNYSSSKVWTQTDIDDAATATYSYTLTITDVKKTVTYDITTSQICISRLGGGKGVTLFGEAQREGFWIVENGVYKYQGAGSVEYIKGTQTASTNIWKGVTKDSALYDGKMIMYVLPQQGTSSAAKLRLTLAGGGTTADIPIYRYGGTTAITTHYSAGSRILLIYDSVNNRWNSSAWYDSNDNNKVAITTINPASETTYYPLMYSAVTGTAGVNTHVNDINKIRRGTTSQEGWAIHQLGNSGAYDTDGNSKGYIRLYGSGTGYGQITYTNSTANTTHVLPANANMAGTILEIVEEGTWGDYGRYIKYSNGMAECYGYAKVNTAIDLPYGNAYYHSNNGTTVTFPSGLFIAGPIINITIERNVDGLYWVSVRLSTKDTVKFFIASARQESTAADTWFHVTAKGKWK